MLLLRLLLFVVFIHYVDGLVPNSIIARSSPWPFINSGDPFLYRNKGGSRPSVTSRKRIAVFSGVETPSPEERSGAVEEGCIEVTGTTPEKVNGETSFGKSKVNTVTFNLIKAISGSGVLALPSGLAVMSDHPSSLVPAIGLMTVMGGISGYTFALYGRLVHASQAKSLGELWEKKKNNRSAWLVSVASLTFCFGACLSYSILLGDLSSSIAQTIGWNGILTSRKFWIVLLTTVVLYPICILRSLLVLAPLSLAGVGAVFMTTFFIVFRCPMINAGSPYAEAGGKLLKTLTVGQIPKFNTFNNGLCHPSSLILLGMAASAYL